MSVDVRLISKDGKVTDLTMHTYRPTIRMPVYPPLRYDWAHDVVTQPAINYVEYEFANVGPISGAFYYYERH